VLTVNRFRMIDRLVNLFMTLVAVALGIGIALISNQTLTIVVLSIISLVDGALLTLVIGVLYRWNFPDGVPKSPASQIISPDYYSIVLWRYFKNFAKFLVWGAIIGLIFLVLSIIAQNR